MGPWMLMISILTMSYSATLRSNLTAIKIKAIPNTVEELANNLHKRPLLVVREMDFADRILVETFHS